MSLGTSDHWHAQWDALRGPAHGIDWQRSPGAYCGLPVPLNTTGTTRGPLGL